MIYYALNWLSAGSGSNYMLLLYSLMPGTMSIQEKEQIGMIHQGKRSRVSFSQRQLQELERTFVHQRWVCLL